MPVLTLFCRNLIFNSPAREANLESWKRWIGTISAFSLSGSKSLSSRRGAAASASTSPTLSFNDVRIWGAFRDSDPGVVSRGNRWSFDATSVPQSPIFLSFLFERPMQKLNCFVSVGRRQNRGAPKELWSCYWQWMEFNRMKKFIWTSMEGAITSMTFHPNMN